VTAVCACASLIPVRSATCLINSSMGGSPLLLNADRVR
jgi:hypothetical protein